jgi:hypothetical protein
METSSILLGILGGLGLPEILLIMLLIFLPVCLLPLIFYIITLQKALQRCALENQAMDPAQVWLLLIPVFNLAWQFVVVSNIAKSLEKEFRSRNLPIEPEPGKTVGLAFCILSVCSMIPFLGFLTAVAGLVCWIVYWIKIANFSSTLFLAQLQNEIP